jgi:hypothetical protein
MVEILVMLGKLFNVKSNKHVAAKASHRSITKRRAVLARAEHDLRIFIELANVLGQVPEPTPREVFAAFESLVPARKLRQRPEFIAEWAFSDDEGGVILASTYEREQFVHAFARLVRQALRTVAQQAAHLERANGSPKPSSAPGWADFYRDGSVDTETALWTAVSRLRKPLLPPIEVRSEIVLKVLPEGRVWRVPTLLDSFNSIFLRVLTSESVDARRIRKCQIASGFFTPSARTRPLVHGGVRMRFAFNASAKTTLDTSGIAAATAS